ncbi:sensor histidine kinase [Mangrovivirga cuniculi]|uniref:histidine kinase n=1 Tax=Mangrovivirga cuniculi TaxID=2715131 RepID=A0A4D7JM30_9BACT|nr:HAMP domain-containing sensor histidine kinase [Mangrovivirga cuniculi]QCK15707.1 hypothetical protein DCC35_13615 [Mangrovivirga cuniculi]
MRLAKFIKNHKELIIDEWVNYAQNYIEPALDMGPGMIEDHISEMLDQIPQEMEQFQTKEEREEKSKNLEKVLEPDNKPSKLHGEQRVDIGFDIVHVSSEFRALRASVLRLYDEKIGVEAGEQKFQDIIRFNEAIDRAWMHSVARYHNLMDQSKNWFLGILGHDLRSPLASIASIQELLSKTENLSPDGEELLQHSRTSIRRMNDLISNLLELTNLRLGSGITVNKTNCDLTSHCKHIIEEFKITYPKADIQINSPGPINGQWDDLRIGQVVANLITNALRYGRPGGPVVVNLSAKDKEATIAVHNEGEPIPENKKEIIFNGMFKDTEENEDSRQSSFGFGLFIVNKIAEAHDGSVDLESTKEKGTTFMVNLPRY